MRFIATPPPRRTAGAGMALRAVLLCCVLGPVWSFRARDPTLIDLTPPQLEDKGTSRLDYKYPSQYPADYVRWAKLPDPTPPTVQVPKKFPADVYCTACCRLADGIEQKLAMDMRSALAKERAKKASRRSVGVLDELANDQIDAACHFAPIWHNKTLQGPCKHILEKHAEKLAATLVKAIGDEPIEPDAQAQTAAMLRRALCWDAARACKPEAAETWVPPSLKTELISDRPRPKEHNRGPVYVAVGADVDEQIGITNTDVIVYVYWGASDEYQKVGPQFDRVAEILAIGRPSSLCFVTVDGRRNELPATYGLNQLGKDTIVMYDADDKTNPTLMEWPDGADMTLYDYLHYLMDAARHQDSRKFLGRIAQLIPDDWVHRSDWLSRKARKRFDLELKRARAKANKGEL